MSNMFGQKSPEALVGLIQLVQQKVPSAPNLWGFTDEMLDAIDAAESETGTAITNQTAAIGANKAAIQVKITAK